MSDRFMRWLHCLILSALTGLLLLSGATEAQEGVCLNEVTLRNRACPPGTSCKTPGSSTDPQCLNCLTVSEGDDNAENIANLCNQSKVFFGQTGLTLTGGAPFLTLNSTAQGSQWTTQTAGTDLLEMSYAGRTKVRHEDGSGGIALGYDLPAFSLEQGLTLATSGPSLRQT